MQMNIHRVKELELQAVETRKIGGETDSERTYYTRDIKVYTSDGREFELCLYAEDAASLSLNL